jgi:hypothetical protein
MLSPIWIAGALGYYSSLVVWIIAQRTHHLHGKYSHSWAIGAMLLIFGALQIVGAGSSLLIATALTALIMPLIVTTMDVKDHRKSGRGLLEHESHCWMEAEAVKNQLGLVQSKESD